jgi:hypothetical protein
MGANIIRAYSYFSSILARISIYTPSVDLDDKVRSDFFGFELIEVHVAFSSGQLQTFGIDCPFFSGFPKVINSVC